MLKGRFYTWPESLQNTRGIYAIETVHHRCRRAGGGARAGGVQRPGDVHACCGWAAAQPTDAPAPADATIFTLVPDQTTVSFTIGEVLNGQHNIVVGKTTGATGQIAIDYANPSTAEVRDFSVNITGLATDNNMRNRTLHGLILQTGNATNAVVTFEQTGISGMPSQIVVGQPVTFQLTGNLTIHGMTQPETFDVTATPVSDTQITGTATVEIAQYSDFGISILRLPQQVASVEDNVKLEIDFVAQAGS